MRGSASGAVSWIQKPRSPVAREAVTTPGTPATFAPSSGETRVVPWMSRIRLSPGSGSGSTSPGPWPLELTGVGAPTAKSAELSSVSSSAGRAADVALARLPVGVPSRTTVDVP
ncbi:hypothetical protein ABZ816_08185 [Actinosynnema sp. NPDC047251]|uniref:hypothetical protein n=1 Tax=Saccharothrix espanaensis TaxID=103731 RepID=UPI0026A4526C